MITTVNSPCTQGVYYIKVFIGLQVIRLIQLSCGTQIVTQRTLGQTSKPVSLSGLLSRTAIKYWK